MSINQPRAFENLDGYSVIDNDGNVKGYITMVTGDPTGSSAPINTFVFRQDTLTVWYKFGAGDNDWRQIRAEDSTFDPTGLLNIPPTDTTVQAALETLGNQSVADIAEIESFESTPQETTTSNGWVSKSGFPWTSASKTAGIFSVRWFYEVGQTKASRNFGYRTLLTAPTSETLSEIPVAGISNDNQRFMQSGFQEYELLSDGPLTVDVQFGQTTDGFSAIMQNVAVEIRRLGDIP